MNVLPKEIVERREAARAAGQPTFMGRPCKRGHSGERSTSTSSCLQCGRDKANARYARPGVAQRQKGLAANWRRSNPEQAMWLRAKHRALRKGLEFTITPKDIKIPELCPVFGTPMGSPSLDRDDNSKGYVPSNICVISTRANTIKGSATVEELVALLRYLQRV